MTNYAANLSMMFTEVPFPERFARAAHAGFEAVEFLFPYAWRETDLAERLRANALKQVLFNMPPGDWDAGERGLACHPGRTAEFRASVRTAIGYAEALGCPRMHCMAGLVPDNAAADLVRTTFLENAAFAAAACAERDLTCLIEPINPVDMPGYFLNDFELALDLIGTLEARGEPAPKLQFDIYHCARIHGDVPAWIRRCAPVTAHYQIAGTPDRHEPDIGTLPLGDILAAVDSVHPDLWIGCEYRPRGRTEDGLGWRDRG